MPRRPWWRRLGPARPSRASLTRIETAVRSEARRLYGAEGAPEPAAAVARPRRRPARLAVAGGIAALVVGGGAGAAILLQGGDGAVNVDPAAERPIAESSDLRRAPWLFQPDGSPHIATVGRGRALLFPPGTTYARAVDRLVRSVLSRGVVPSEASIVPPLPAGVVWQPGAAGTGPVLSLVAPLGYSVPEGRIRTPAYRFGPDVSTDQARALLLRSGRGAPVGEAALRGVSVQVPRLPACQIAPAGRAPVRCRVEPPPAAAEPGS